MKTNATLTAAAFGLLTFTAARPLEKDETSTLPGFVGSSILVPVEDATHKEKATGMPDCLDHPFVNYANCAFSSIPTTDPSPAPTPAGPDCMRYPLDCVPDMGTTGSYHLVTASSGGNLPGSVIPDHPTKTGFASVPDPYVLTVSNVEHPKTKSNIAKRTPTMETVHYPTPTEIVSASPMPMNATTTDNTGPGLPRSLPTKRDALPHGDLYPPSLYGLPRWCHPGDPDDFFLDLDYCMSDRQKRIIAKQGAEAKYPQAYQLWALYTYCTEKEPALRNDIICTHQPVYDGKKGKIFEDEERMQELAEDASLKIALHPHAVRSLPLSPRNTTVSCTKDSKSNDKGECCVLSPVFGWVCTKPDGKDKASQPAIAEETMHKRSDGAQKDGHPYSESDVASLKLEDLPRAADGKLDPSQIEWTALDGKTVAPNIDAALIRQIIGNETKAVTQHTPRSEASSSLFCRRWSPLKAFCKRSGDESASQHFNKLPVMPTGSLIEALQDANKHNGTEVKEHDKLDEGTKVGKYLPASHRHDLRRCLESGNCPMPGTERYEEMMKHASDRYREDSSRPSPWKIWMYVKDLMMQRDEEEGWAAHHASRDLPAEDSRPLDLPHLTKEWMKQHDHPAPELEDNYLPADIDVELKSPSQDLDTCKFGGYCPAPGTHRYEEMMVEAKEQYRHGRSKFSPEKVAAYVEDVTEKSGEDADDAGA